MDLEIVMVLTSNTLACVFVGLQLFYVKKHPDVLPFISLVMLVILTLGHMIPLVLNFEAMFLQNRNRQNVLLGSGGWLEVNEVIVRVVTMVAFLLQFRLLQLALGCTIGRWKPKDGFLFPQILFNVFQISKESSLSRSFYIGTTFVRLLPHAYDLYRAHNYVQRHFDGSYFYANPTADFYSTVWDIIIPLGGMLFAVIIYLQQKFGGRCILPGKFRESRAYEKVPVVSSE
ncbi:hypothetical protein F0562_010321 [Nyssa sinensis]|uniref:RING-type E3 ubiquitin transferase n=1 Tax=Nyssa sinensis TaxID=561372 RepID=A0A5J5A1N5_9ASTE|nr:hypothetical protein F0562_010321 [Nyssa sinensis]